MMAKAFMKAMIPIKRSVVTKTIGFPASEFGTGTHVVVMKAQVHEASLGVQERKEAVEGKLGRELHYPYEHEGRHFACAARHRQYQTRHDARHGLWHNDVPDGLPFRGAAGERALPHGAGNGGERLLCRHDHDGNGEERQRQGRPQKTARLLRPSGWGGVPDKITGRSGPRRCRRKTRGRTRRRRWRERPQGCSRRCARWRPGRPVWRIHEGKGP